MLPQDVSAPAPIPLAPGVPLGPDKDHDVASWAAAFGVHQVLSQVTAAPQVTQAPSMISENLNGIEPPQLGTNPSQPFIDPSQIYPSQSLSGSSKTPAEAVATIPPQLTNAADTTTVDSVPKVQYRVRDSGTTAPKLPSRRSSIDGVPEMVVDPHVDSEVPSNQDSVDDDAPEVVVDLRDYISMMSDSDEESHVSSSQKSADACWDDLPPPPSSQWRKSGSKRREGVANRSRPSLTPTHVQLDVDEGDLPTWMVKKAQWNYLASTAGGPTWEKLLNAYMQQERRLGFTETVSNLSCAFLHPWS